MRNDERTRNDARAAAAPFQVQVFTAGLSPGNAPCEIPYSVCARAGMTAVRCRLRFPLGASDLGYTIAYLESRAPNNGDFA